MWNLSHDNCSALGTQRHKHPQDEGGTSPDACCQLGGKLEKKFPVTKKQTLSLRIRVEAFPLEKVWLCFQTRPQRMLPPVLAPLHMATKHSGCPRLGLNHGTSYGEARVDACGNTRRLQLWRAGERCAQRRQVSRAGTG